MQSFYALRNISFFKGITPTKLCLSKRTLHSEAVGMWFQSCFPPCSCHGNLHPSFPLCRTNQQEKRKAFPLLRAVCLTMHKYVRARDWHSKLLLLHLRKYWVWSQARILKFASYYCNGMDNETAFTLISLGALKVKVKFYFKYWRIFFGDVSF